MRWPWTRSIELANEAADRWYNQSEHYRLTLKDERQRYESLLERYHVLRLQGGNEPPAPPKPLEKKNRSPVEEAITEWCGNNRKLRRRCEEFAQALRQTGLDEVAIALQIEQGNVDTDGVPT